MLSKYYFLGICLLFFYLIAIFLALGLGEEYLNPKELIFYIFKGDELTREIILNVRLPRVLMAILVGMLLASSGVITQNVFSNPLADPYIIGIASAASFGAILAHILGLGDYYFGIFAFICSGLFSLFIFKISKKSSLSSLLIIGIATSSFLGALSSFLVYYIGEDSFKIITWLMGHISAASLERVFLIFAPLLFCLTYFYIHKNSLNILLSGDDEARNLGVDAAKLKIRLLLASSLACSFALAFTGLIAFVGLIIPHITRLLLKNYNNILVLPFCTLIGGLFLLFCDSLARSVLAPIEIPIGVVTSFFAAPIFLYLALKIRNFL